MNWQNLTYFLVVNLKLNESLFYIVPYYLIPLFKYLINNATTIKGPEYTWMSSFYVFLQQLSHRL